MPFDREGTLRKAEKLLRQGKLDLAIAEYRSVIEDQPSDWNTANTLGDLYFRAGQVDKALVEYGRIADHLANEGFTSKAVALYRKILKIKPDDERSMWNLGQIAAKQGLLVDARASFLNLAQRRRARGDRRGEAEVRVCLGDLEGADLETQLGGARARVELGDTGAAVARLKQIAVDLQERGKEKEALKLLREAATLAPQDNDLKRSLMLAYVAQGDFETARQYATSARELQEVADELFRQGREDEGLAMLAAAAEADPSDSAVRTRLVKALVARGDMAGARGLLTPEVAGSDPELLWTLAEMELRDGRIQEGTDVLQRILVEHPGRRDALVILGCSVAEVNSDAGFECIEVAARAAIAADEWGSAAAALNEFVNRVPNHIPALMRLVEICVDGGLEATMHSAQTQLADAYLSVGAGSEARIIAEDLVAREPWERSNIERFRTALTLLGEADIDAIIADRLSGQAPFTSTDFLWPAEPPSPEPIATPASAAPEPKAHAPAPASASSTAPPPGVPPHTVAPRAKFSHAIDLKGILGGEGHEDAAPAPRMESHEINLNDQLHDLRSADARASSGPAQPGVSIENVLKNVRDEAAHDASPETAEQHYKLATTYLEMGMTDEAMKALEVAARSLRHRFRAGALLAKLHLERGAQHQAIEWFERAAEAPAPDPDAAHQLLYDLATVLESEGESGRALAVFMELQAEAGDYRDLAARLEHLTKVQTGN